MLNLEPELRALAEAGAIEPAEAAKLIARERREIFSVQPELRVLSWAGAILIATGAGVLLARNLDRIGPLVLASGVALAALAAYAYAVWRRRTSRASFVDEYVLLLGALLLSADLAYIEGQFHLLDHGWPRHLLVLAIVHGLTAYYFDSKTLLSLSLAALAAWMGIEQRVETIFNSTTETAARAFACSALILIWRIGHTRWRARHDFQRVFEHFAANLALLGGLVFTFEENTRYIGFALTLIVASMAIYHAFLVRGESFAIYAYVYAVIAMLVVAVGILAPEEVLIFGACALILALAIAGLFRLRYEFRRRAS